MKMLLLTSGIAILFTSAMFVLFDVVTFKQDVVRQLDVLSKAIARNSTAALAFDNPDDGRGVLAAFGADRHIVSAVLVRRIGPGVRHVSRRLHRGCSAAADARRQGARFEAGHVVCSIRWSSRASRSACSW